MNTIFGVSDVIFFYLNKINIKFHVIINIHRKTKKKNYTEKNQQKYFSYEIKINNLFYIINIIQKFL